VTDMASNSEIIETLTRGPATRRDLEGAHGKGVNKDLQWLKKDGYVEFKNREWHLVSKTPPPALVSFLKSPHPYLCIAVDPTHTDIDELSRLTGIPIVRTYREYHDFASAISSGVEPFLIDDALLWFECQNWEQTFYRKEFHVWRDRHRYQK
jgi:hypothetical protein